MSYRIRMAGIATAAMVLAVAGLGQIVAAAPATALPPGNCYSAATANNSGQVVCLNAKYGFQVRIQCIHDGTVYSNYGQVKSSGGVSVADCNLPDDLATAPNDDNASVFICMGQCGPPSQGLVSAHRRVTQGIPS